jgi:hypothetical protein
MPQLRLAISVLAVATTLSSVVQGQAAAPPAYVGMSDAAQIVSAVAPLPKEMRDGATVMAWKGEALVTLRKGSNDMTCLGPDPKRTSFHTACYQNGMEPFMKRGRDLRASGVTGDQVDSVRFREVRQKKLLMPNRAMSLYSLTGGTVDPATGEVKGARPLFVVYIPFATSKSTGLSTQPLKDGPWLMLPGTPKAHIMFQSSM